MLAAAQFLPRIAAFVAGLVLAHIALFMFPDERGRLQSALETWWLRVAESRTSTDRRHIRWLRKMAAIGSHGLKKVYGPTVWSRRAFNSALLLSLSSLLLTEGAAMYMLGSLTPADMYDAPTPLVRFVESDSHTAAMRVAGMFFVLAGLSLVGTFVVMLGTERRLWRSGAWLLQNLTVAVLVALSVWVIAAAVLSPVSVDVGLFRIDVDMPEGSGPGPSYSFATSPEYFAWLLPGWLVGALADFAMIALFRRTLMRVPAATARGAVALMAASLLLVMSLYVLPRVPALLLFLDALQLISIPFEVPPRLAMMLGVAAESNLYVTLIPLAMLVVALALLVDRTLLPIVERVTHDPISNKVIQNKTLLWGAVAVLMGFAITGDVLGPVKWMLGD